MKAKPLNVTFTVSAAHKPWARWYFEKALRTDNLYVMVQEDAVQPVDYAHYSFTTKMDSETLRKIICNEYFSNGLMKWNLSG